MIGDVSAKSSVLLNGDLGFRASLSADISSSCIISELEVGKISVIKRTAEEYSGEYEVTPMADAQMLQTKNKLMVDNVEIKAIPYYDVSNEFGRTIYIGGDLDA